MGSIYTASCDCGYIENEVLIGRTSFISVSSFSFPYYCPGCKILFDGNLPAYEPDNAETVCPKCDTTGVIPYYDERVCHLEENEHYDLNDFTRRLSFNRGKCLCPACGKFDLVFEHQMSYD